MPPLPIRGCPCGGPTPPKKRGRKRTRSVECPKGVCDGSGVIPWHPFVRTWWARAWASPMASQWIEADLDGLFELAQMKEDYWGRKFGDPNLHKEIRQQEVRFGFAPLDRRRLEWGLEQPDDETPEVPTPEPQPTGTDARAVLRMVK